MPLPLLPMRNCRSRWTPPCHQIQRMIPARTRHYLRGSGRHCEGCEAAGGSCWRSGQVKKFETKMQSSRSERKWYMITSSTSIQNSFSYPMLIQFQTQMMHNLLKISLNPSIPASLHNIPTKYNIIIWLWTHAFHKLLETLQRDTSFCGSFLALEHLQEFIYYAHKNVFKNVFIVYL